MRAIRALAAAAVVAVTMTMAEPVQATLAPGQQIVLNGENNRLNAYDAVTGAKRTVIPSAADDPVAGLDINAEICVVPEGVAWKPAGEIWFIAGEDTEQNTVPGVIRQGWGLFRLEGATLAELRAVEVGKLVPDSFVTANDNPENFGCGVLPDGRLVTSDVGDQLPHSPATGQVIVWFPTADLFTGPVGPGRTDFARVPHCKVDVALGTAGGIAVDGANVYVASNRPNLQTAQPGGVYRYNTSVWPTGESAAGGCGRADATGEQLADAGRVGKSLLIAQNPILLTPSDLVVNARGTFYISSVFNGVVAEYTKQGVFVRTVLVSSGQVGQLAGQPSGITPFGLSVTRDGAVWVADIGVVGPGPFPGAGSVVRIPIGANGVAGQPQIVDQGLQFPDGIGVVTL